MRRSGERIIELYTPYVLVRCSRYTNGRRQAQQIGVYTLVTHVPAGAGGEAGGAGWAGSWRSCWAWSGRMWWRGRGGRIGGIGGDEPLLVESADAADRRRR